MPASPTPAPDDAALHRRLAERAAKYARRRHAEAPAATRALLLLEAGSQVIGIAVSEVSEVARIHTYAPVPHAAPKLLGVVNIQNELYSLLDLAALVGSPTPADEPPARAVVLRHPELRLALACREILGLEEIPADRIQADGAFPLGQGFGSLLETPVILAALDISPTS